MIRIGDVLIASQLFWTFMEIMPSHVTGVAILPLVITKYETQYWQLAIGQSFSCMWAKTSSARKQYKTVRRVFTQLYSRTTAALDVTIMSPLQASIFSDAARTHGFALTLADYKIGHYSQKCSHRGIHFIPLVLKFFGGLSETTRKTLKRIAHLSDNRGFKPSSL